MRTFAPNAANTETQFPCVGKNVVTNSEGSAKAESTDPNQSQNTEGITEVNQADRPDDLTNVVTNSEGSAKAESTDPNQSQNTEAITAPDQADRVDDLKNVVINESTDPNQSQNTEGITEVNQADQPDDLTNVVTNSEGSAKAESTDPNQSQNTEAITAPDQADRVDDLNEKGSQSQTSKEGAENTTDPRLEAMRSKMVSYKVLYDAGQPLPEGTDDDFFPDCVEDNSEYESQIADWMVEFSVPEIYMKTLESTTYTTWLGEKSTWIAARRALKNLRYLTWSSKILAERLLATGFLEYAVKNLKDQRYLENYEDNEVAFDVLHSMIKILRNCTEKIPDHAPYKELNLTQALEPYFSAEDRRISGPVRRIISKVASKEQKKKMRDADLEALRAQMASYKALYDAGKPLPEDTDDNFYPSYVQDNSEFKSQIADWMVEYSVPEMYLKTLDSTTYTTWRNEESPYRSADKALDDLYYFTKSSKILAERLLEIGFMNFTLKNLTDQRFLDNYEVKQGVRWFLRNIFDTIEHIVTLVPNHIAYKQQDLTQVLKKYLCSPYKNSALAILLAVVCEEESTALVNAELEPIRAKMECYKQLYDAGDCLPGGSDYELCPGYWKYKTVYQEKVVPWMLEYKVPELFKRTLDEMTSTAICTDDEVKTTCITVLSFFGKMSAVSKDVVEKLIELNCIEYFVNLLTMLTDHQFTDWWHNWRREKVLKPCFDTILMCVRSEPGHLIYKKLKLNEVVKPYLASDDMVLRAIAMMIYSFVIGEDESKQLDDAGCIPYIVNGIHAAIYGKRCFDVEYHCGVSFEINDLLKCVNRIAANDTNKKKLVDEGLLPLLVTSLKTGNEEEQEITAKLTWTLCFDEQTKQRVINEPDLVNELELLSKSTNQAAKKAAEGALWKASREDKRQQQTKQQTNKNKHIFISYQWDNQTMAKRLNKRLKDDDYPTWIDVEQMGGSTLDAMAAAVENAALVLICASEKYKESNNCHTEGQYTFQIKKAFVPLMMQRHYKPDGWLGMLMGTRLYINFDGKYEFEEAYQMLMKEMTPILQVAMKPDTDAADGAAKVPQGTTKSYSASPASQLAPQPASFIDPPVASWNMEKVLEWATKYNLTQHSAKFDSLLEGMDGKKLVKFCEMRNEVPNFWYKLVRKQCKLDIMAFISLKLAMDDLQQYQPGF